MSLVRSINEEYKIHSQDFIELLSSFEEMKMNKGMEKLQHEINSKIGCSSSHVLK